MNYALLVRGEGILCGEEKETETRGGEAGT